MSAKTAPALNPGGDPVTPVIIKSGGGNEDPDDPRQVRTDPRLVSIDSGTFFFAETVPGPTWVSSQSTVTGRITMLKIRDGATITRHRITPTEHLASVTLKFGAAQLTAMESGVAADNNVVLLLTSPEFPFGVNQIGDWNSATTMFHERLTNVLLMVGNQQKLLYNCENPGVTVKIKFERD